MLSDPTQVEQMKQMILIPGCAQAHGGKESQAVRNWRLKLEAASVALSHAGLVHCVHMTSLLESKHD